MKHSAPERKSLAPGLLTQGMPIEVPGDPKALNKLVRKRNATKYLKCRTCIYVSILWKSFVSVTSQCPKAGLKGYVKKADCESCSGHKTRENSYLF